MLRGRLLSRPLPDTASAGPALLRRTDARMPPSINPVAGLVWLSVDALCGINYEVILSFLFSHEMYWKDSLHMVFLVIIY